MLETLKAFVERELEYAKQATSLTSWCYCYDRASGAVEFAVSYSPLKSDKINKWWKQKNKEFFDIRDEVMGL